MRNFAQHSLNPLGQSGLRGDQGGGNNGPLAFFLGSALYCLISLYRVSLSPLLPPSCRFSPSCSEYALQALTHHGLLKAIRLIGWRLLRCHPFHPGGYDPLT